MSSKRPVRAASRTFARAVRELRLRKGMTQRQMAAGAEMPVSTYNRIENSVAAVDLEQMVAIARAFGMSFSQLMEKVALVELATKRGQDVTLESFDFSRVAPLWLSPQDAQAEVDGPGFVDQQQPAVPYPYPHYRYQNPKRKPSLSSREVQVLQAYLRTDKRRAASSLGIGEATLATHLARIRHKYTALRRDVTTKPQMLARAVEDDLISLDEI